MSASVGGAIREALMAQYGVTVEGPYLDFAPESVEPPYLTYNDPVAHGPSLRGDGASLRFSRTLQYNLFQRTDQDDPNLPMDIAAFFDGMSFSVDGYGGSIKVQLESALRVAEPQETGLIHHEYTINLHTVPGTP